MSSTAAVRPPSSTRRHFTLVYPTPSHCSCAQAESRSQWDEVGSVLVAGMLPPQSMQPANGWGSQEGEPQADIAFRYCILKSPFQPTFSPVHGWCTTALWSAAARWSTPDTDHVQSSHLSHTPGMGMKRRHHHNGYLVNTTSWCDLSSGPETSVLAEDLIDALCANLCGNTEISLNMHCECCVARGRRRRRWRRT